jgi:hypothetical protein
MLTGTILRTSQKERKREHTEERERERSPVFIQAIFLTPTEIMKMAARNYIVELPLIRDRFDRGVSPVITQLMKTTRAAD